MKFIVSPFYGVSNQVVELYAQDNDLVFVMVDEDSPIVPAYERSAWLLHTLGTTAINLTGVAEAEENEEFMAAVDSAIRKHMVDNNVEDAEVYFEVMDSELFSKHFKCPFGKKELKAHKLMDMESIPFEEYSYHSNLSPRFLNLFGSRVAALQKPVIEEKEPDVHVLFPVFTYKGNEFVACTLSIREGVTVPMTNVFEDYIPHSLVVEVFSKILGDGSSSDTFFKFLPFGKERRESHFFNLGEVSEDSVLGSVMNSKYVGMTGDTVVRALPIESVKTLSADFALLYNVYQVGLEELKKQDELAFEGVE